MKPLKFLLIALVLFSSCEENVENEKVFTIGNVAANGYDLVSYFNATVPSPGLQEYSIDHNGTKYHFSNNENMVAFKSDPDKYLPAYGGYCAYAMANDGNLMLSNPDKYEIQDGKLYLFFDNFLTSIQGGLQKEWNTDPKGYKNLADKNWVRHIDNLENQSLTKSELK